jgi:hypothetical protein
MSVKKNRPRSLGMALVVGVILCLLGPATAAPAEKKGKGGVKPATAWVYDHSDYKVRAEGLAVETGLEVVTQVGQNCRRKGADRHQLQPPV